MEACYTDGRDQKYGLLARESSATRFSRSFTRADLCPIAARYFRGRLTDGKVWLAKHKPRWRGAAKRREISRDSSWIIVDVRTECFTRVRYRHWLVIFTIGCARALARISAWEGDVNLWNGARYRLCYCWERCVVNNLCFFLSFTRANNGENNYDCSINVLLKR